MSNRSHFLTIARHFLTIARHFLTIARRFLTIARHFLTVARRFLIICLHSAGVTPGFLMTWQLPKPIGHQRGPIGLEPGALQQPLRGDLHTFPEGNAVFYVPGRFAGLRIVPGRVLVYLAVHDNIVVAGQAFPWACRVRIAVVKEFLLYGIARKVMISFNNHSCIAFRQRLAIPNCLHKTTSSTYERNLSALLPDRFHSAWVVGPVKLELVRERAR